LVFFTHDVTGAPSPFGCNPGQLEAVVAYAAERSTILPVRDVIAGLPNSNPLAARYSFVLQKLKGHYRRLGAQGARRKLPSRYTRINGDPPNAPIVGRRHRAGDYGRRDKVTWLVGKGRCGGIEKISLIPHLCLDDCFTTLIMPQPTEITQFIFGQSLS
jgi:hypothetical protein